MLSGEESEVQIARRRKRLTVKLLHSGKFGMLTRLQKLKSQRNNLRGLDLSLWNQHHQGPITGNQNTPSVGVYNTSGPAHRLFLLQTVDW